MVMIVMTFMKTTITISKDLKDKLDEISTKSESYDIIVQRLYDGFMKTRQQTVQMFAREQLKKYGDGEISPVKKAMLKEVAKGNSRPWSEVRKEILDE